MAAGLATLNLLSEKSGIYEELDRKADKLCRGLKKGFEENGVPVTINRVGSMMTMFFTSTKVRDYDTAIKSDVGLYSRYFREMLSKGIYLPPAQFETFFVSSAHTDEDIEATVGIAAEVAKTLR